MAKGGGNDGRVGSSSMDSFRSIERCQTPTAYSNTAFGKAGVDCRLVAGRVAAMMANSVADIGDTAAA
jgi:hypothetical protein